MTSTHLASLQGWQRQKMRLASIRLTCGAVTYLEYVKILIFNIKDKNLQSSQVQVKSISSTHFSFFVLMKADEKSKGLFLLLLISTRGVALVLVQEGLLLR